MPFEPLTTISSIDGRYRDSMAALVPYFSEYALIHMRTVIECEYLITLSENRKTGMRTLSGKEKKTLRRMADISLEDARIVKAIEKKGYLSLPATNHDVKAVEYFLKSKIKGTSLEDISEWIHFALTSEDINSIAHGFALRSALAEVILPALREIRQDLKTMAKKYAQTPMLARTHGQPASPTTFGKEMRVFESRLSRQIAFIEGNTILVKFGGATGNFNAHLAAAPSVDWQRFAERFVASLNKGREIALELNPITTQIEPHDTYAELFDVLRRINTICIDLSQDMWRYISDGWVTQKPKAGEVGSSAMPHKVNPIDFENAEGNFGVANALFEHFSRKLPISRLQRDLSDSTVERTFGTAFAHTLIGFTSLVRGLGKIAVNEKGMLEVLQSHPEVLAEAFQTVLRKEGVAVPYEKLKELTRGKQVTLADFARFIDGLDVSDKIKKSLKTLKPENYIGLAAQIAKK